MRRTLDRRRARDPGLLGEAAGAARRTFLGALASAFRRTVDDAVERTVGRLVSASVAAALLITAAVFLLVAGVEGLKAAALPPYAGYLILGGVGLGAGLLVVRLTR